MAQTTAGRPPPPCPCTTRADVDARRSPEEPPHGRRVPRGSHGRTDRIPESLHQKATALTRSFLASKPQPQKYIPRQRPSPGPSRPLVRPYLIPGVALLAACGPEIYVPPEVECSVTPTPSNSSLVGTWRSLNHSKNPSLHIWPPDTYFQFNEDGTLVDGYYARSSDPLSCMGYWAVEDSLLMVKTCDYSVFLPKPASPPDPWWPEGTNPHSWEGPLRTTTHHFKFEQLDRLLLTFPHDYIEGRHSVLVRQVFSLTLIQARSEGSP